MKTQFYVANTSLMHDSAPRTFSPAEYAPFRKQRFAVCVHASMPRFNVDQVDASLIT